MERYLKRCGTIPQRPKKNKSGFNVDEDEYVENSASLPNINHIARQITKVVNLRPGRDIDQFLPWAYRGSSLKAVP
jgi:hypothetical protein